MLPRTIVMAAFTLMSFPQQTTRFPWVGLIAALMLTSRSAFNVSVVLSAAPTRVQVIGSLTVILPAPLPVLVVLMVMLVPPVRPLAASPTMVATFTLAVVAPAVGVKMPPANVSFNCAAVEIVTSVGSSSHVPGLPFGALALTLMPDTSSQ